jgi:hypothetical protein
VQVTGDPLLPREPVTTGCVDVASLLPGCRAAGLPGCRAAGLLGCDDAKAERVVLPARRNQVPAREQRGSRRLDQKLAVMPPSTTTVAPLR